MEREQHRPRQARSRSLELSNELDFLVVKCVEPGTISETGIPGSGRCSCPSEFLATWLHLLVGGTFALSLSLTQMSRSARGTRACWHGRSPIGLHGSGSLSYWQARLGFAGDDGDALALTSYVEQRYARAELGFDSPTEFLRSAPLSLSVSFNSQDSPAWRQRTLAMVVQSLNFRSRNRKARSRRRTRAQNRDL